MFEIRRVRTDDEYAAAGEVTVAAYAADGYLVPDDDYVPWLRDTARRDETSEVWVAVGEDGLVGTVTYCPPGAREREIAWPDEGEFRALAVAPSARGQGVGEALARHCLRRARDQGLAGVGMSSLAEMHAAHRLYARLGFHRDPSRDWSPTGITHLVVFAVRF